jgi:hypothetical protein
MKMTPQPISTRQECGQSTMVLGTLSTALFSIMHFMPQLPKTPTLNRQSLRRLQDPYPSKCLHHLHIAIEPQAWLGGQVRWALQAIPRQHRLSSQCRLRTWIRSFKKPVGFVLILQFAVPPHLMVSRDGLL